MTREEAIQVLKNTAWLGSNEDREATEEAIDMAIEALSQPIVAKCYEIDNDRVYCSPEIADKIYRALHEDTNVQNMHKGEWVDIDNYYRVATCSHCHKVTMFEKWGEYTKPYNFCPNCGAKIYKGGDDE